jgi:hypothetical protein
MISSGWSVQVERRRRDQRVVPKSKTKATQNEDYNNAVDGLNTLASKRIGTRRCRVDET